MSKLASISSVLLAMTCACGPKAAGNGDGNGDGGNSATDGQGGSNGNGSNGSDGNPGSACATSTVKAQQTPLDLYVMLDQSKSMDQQNKWTDVTAALDSFVTQPLTNVSVGLQFFGQPGAGGGQQDSCTASDYATPAVEIAPLPGAATAIQAAIAAHSPSTSTPTSAALQGAVDHAKAWATAHPGDVVVDVLATDGDPTECVTSLASIDAIAQAGATGTPKVLTFVIGVGTSLANLDGIAAAGGTGSAFLVDTGSGANQQFLAAMNAIRHTALGCQYAIPVPASGTPNFNEVNVNYMAGSGGALETFPNVANAAACPATGDAWYYNDDAAPTQIILCAKTCTKVEADSSGEVDVALGCATVID